MPLKFLASDDNLGNISAHFFKSGTALRSVSNDVELTKLREKLPFKEIEERKTKLEYDVSYSSRNDNKISGYFYTDCLGKFVYIRCSSRLRNSEIIKESKKTKINEDGENIFNILYEKHVDKYSLRPTRNKDYNDFVIFLPGNNIYNKIVDEDKITQLIKSENAKIKCHPITPESMLSHLQYKFGKNNIINKELSGHEILANCNKVGFCENTEMGLIAFIKGLDTAYVGKERGSYTYSNFYKHIYFDKKNPNEMKKEIQQDLKSIFSCNFNGLISVDSKNQEERIYNYFKYFEDKFEHEQHSKI